MFHISEFFHSVLYQRQFFKFGHSGPGGIFGLELKSDSEIRNEGKKFMAPAFSKRVSFIGFCVIGGWDQWCVSVYIVHRTRQMAQCLTVSFPNGKEGRLC